MAERYDVAIIGAGTAGLSALNEVRKTTDNFVLINAGPYGTTCARVGCMPSKVLIEAARAYHRRLMFHDFGIRGAKGLSVDIPAALARVRRLRDEFVRGTLTLTERLGERNIQGRARFVGPDTLSVGARTIRADRIIIATGSRPVVPQPLQKLGSRVLTTDDLFEQEDLPASVAVIGLGPVGAEMAQSLARLGIRVTGIDMATRVAGLSDPVVNDKAIECFRTDYSVHLGAPAEVNIDGDKVRVRVGDTDVSVDKVLAALGRQPNVDDLGLETLGVELDARGIPPFDPCSMQVTGLPVFIAGDASNYRPIMYEAADEGHIAGLNAAEGSFGRYTRRTPLAIVFTEPNAAVVGRRFSELQHSEFIIGKADFENQGRAVAAGRNRGILRVYAEKASGLLLGAELCAPDGEHMAHLLALAIQQRLHIQELLAMPFYHPVLEEGLRTALRDVVRRMAVKPVSDLGACTALGADALD